jgi:dTDP-4-amino-4,6-dideoxygalactose transaminase
VDDQVARAVTQALEDEPLSAGKNGIQRRFEKDFAKYHGRRYALMTNSGAAALQLALAGCGVKAGDEVITTPYSWGASTGCIIHQNAIPVFADIDPETLCLDPTKIEGRITDRTRAILVVHLFGMPADMPAIRKIAKERGLAVIEDCSHAAGARLRDRLVGTWGNAGAFSLDASKSLFAGEGGILITHEREIYEEAILEGTPPLRMQAEVRDKERQRYIDSLSFHFRPHPLAAAIASTQLEKLEDRLAEKKRNFDRLFDRVGEILEPHGAEFMRQHKGVVHAYHMVSLKVVHPELREIPRHVIAQALAKEGMPVGGYVQTLIPLRPRFRDLRFYGRGCPWTCRHAVRLPDYSPGSWPVAERLCREGEIVIRGSHHVYDPQRMDQYARAIEKLVTYLDKLRKYAEKKAASAQRASGEPVP